MNRLNDIRVTELHHVFSPCFQKGEVNYTTNRPYYGISFCKDGEMLYEVGDKKIHADKGFAIVFPKGSNYKYTCLKTGSFTLVNFDCVGFGCPDFLRIPISDNDSFLRDHSALEKLDYFNKPYNRAKFLSGFYGILSRVSLEDPQNPYPVLRPAVKYIRENLFNPAISNKMLADEVELSEVYFRKLFKLSYGISPKQYIQSMRIAKAKELLENEAISITKISEKCGYSNLYHFTKMFKEKVGYTPTEYRKIYRKFYF